MKLDGQAKQHNVSIEDTSVIKCDNTQVDLEKGVEITCNSEMFSQGYELRKLSALISPTGKTQVMPIPVFYCLNCGREIDIQGIE